ncbi:type II toxin-antitoxin system PemK/MazF family toxin [Thalassospira sp.]|uniref:type II toxin-antitoxin system PemK/MazF family toxin n=1 Tax=Thalassospira sp. TaxID=1912094 RepID=UPI0027348ADB|nr:type II toxin-antitoxin system PemK/MazF family toxin [Thalassospira sp.]MDP2698931.1 type II toxin-antitoxin system PemK/MazF family toxin [Thalassospira sp.]
MAGVKRGDLVTVAIPGDFGKPRPALIIQADAFPAIGTVTVLLLSGTIITAPIIRLDIVPSPVNGLRKPTQIMIDKIMSVRIERVGKVIGRLDDDNMLAVNQSLALFLGFA